MVKRTRAPKKMNTPEPDKILTTTNTYNKRRKPQQQEQQKHQRYENKSTTMDNAVAATTNIIKTTSVGVVAAATVTKRIKKSTNELQYDSIAPDDDYDSLEDDEEAEESEIDLLDEDDDDVDVDETTLPISSDEEEFLETQRISLPELIVKKLLQTTATSTALTGSTSQLQNSELNVETKKSENERCVETTVSTEVKQTKTKTHQQNPERHDIKSEVSTVRKESIALPKPKQLPEVPITVELKEPQAIDGVKTMLEPKQEKSDIDTKVSNPSESDVNASVVLGPSKRRRGRPPKSKLTEANIQVEAKCDKSLKRTASSSQPCCGSTKPIGVLGLISYNAFDSSLHYQCQLCNVMFFNELQTYTQHLRTLHQVVKDHENTEMGILPARKCARSQQMQATKAAKLTLSTEVAEQVTNAGLHSEDKDSDEQPKDDKENILSKVNNRNMELEREPYFACGLVTLYDAGRLNLVCKYCDCSNLQEEAFKKHLLIEHQGLIMPDNIKEKSPVVDEINPGELALQPIGKITSKQTVEKSYLISGALETTVRPVPSTQHLMATQTPETPPPEEDEEQENKYHSKIENPLEDESLSLAKEVPPTIIAMKKSVKETTHTTEQPMESIDKQQAVPKKDEELSGEEEVKACIMKSSSTTTTPKDKDHSKDLESEGDTRDNESAPSVEDKPSCVPNVLTQQVEDVSHQPKKNRKYRKRHSDTMDLGNKLDTKRATRQSRASSIETTQNNKTQRSKPISEVPMQNEAQNQTQKQRDIETVTTSPTTTNKITKTTLTTPLEKRKRLATAAAITTARSKQSLSLKKEKKDINATASTQVHEDKQVESTPLVLPPSPVSQSLTIATTLKSAKKRGRGAVNSRKQTLTIDSPSKTEAIDDIKTETTIKGTITTTNTTQSAIGAENVKDAIEMTDNKDNKEVEPLNATSANITSSPPSLKAGKPDIYCEICQKVFNKKSRLVEHRRLHTGELPFQCDKCDKRFRLKSRLTEHKMRHLGVKSFKCNVCGLALATKQDLSQHQRYHTDKRPHACPHCPKAFVRSSDFKIHLRIHTGEKPYVCDICNQSFRANQNLYVHRKMHLGVKDYICEFCEKAFMRKIDLRVHMRSHTGEKPFKCEICSRSFSSKFNVRTHIQRLHVANANGIERKKPGRKPNDLRAELERQKELIEELRNQLAQRVKTEQIILQQHCQQQQQPLVILPTATAKETSTNPTSIPTATVTATSGALSSPTTFELKTNDSPTEQSEQKLTNQQSNDQNISIVNHEISPMSIMTTPTALDISPQIEKTTTITTTSSNTIKDVTILNPDTPQPHDISILAVFTAQPHAAMQLNNLSTNSITATMTPLRLQLPTTGQTSAQKKERKITSYFNVLGQKS